MPVYAELPRGAIETTSLIVEHREAKGYVNDKYKNYYFCPKCEGWIEGWPKSARVNTLAPLSGRSGHTEECERCGYELSFMGIVS